MDRLQVQVPDLESYWLKQIKCQEACPVRTDARGEFSFNWKIFDAASRKNETSFITLYALSNCWSFSSPPQSQVGRVRGLMGFAIACKLIRKRKDDRTVSNCSCGNDLLRGVSESGKETAVQRGMCFASSYVTPFPLRTHYSTVNAYL